MKKVAVILVAVILTAMLVACGSTVTTPVRGMWADHYYTNEYLGVRFVLPLGWQATTDAELRMIAGLAGDFMAEAGAEMPEGVESLTEMMASHPLEGSNVQIIFERFRGRAPSRDNFIETAREQIEELGGRVIDTPGTTRIGPYDFYSFGTELEMHGVTIPGRQFVNFHEGYARLIIITLPQGTTTTVEDILGNFIGLDEPIPEPQVVQREHPAELLGTWEWFWDPEVTLTFNANGTGERDFGEGPEHFEWYAEDGNHLVIGAGIGAESWSYTVAADGILLIESRQAPDLFLEFGRIS
ncbi:MAG: hypothetical protein FWC13_01515 [Oscillospiraceae bacterium]|nr:hypothetical protein [Oscillospiraceae bacterium]